MFGANKELMVLVEMLGDFRKRIFWIIFVLCVGTLGGYYYALDVMEYLFKFVSKVIYISPAEGFVTRLKIAFIMGAIATVPIIIFIIFKFIKRKFSKISGVLVFFLSLISYVLFLLGASFAIFIVLPLGLRFLLGFSTPNLEPMLSAGRYVSFASMLLFVFGITFELPMVINLLSRAGILTSTILRQKRKYVVLLMFVLGGFLTPPDVVSQILLAIPLLLLYEISIILARFRERKENKLGGEKGGKNEVSDEMIDEFIG